jgi:hypothetical protein
VVGTGAFQSYSWLDSAIVQNGDTDRLTFVGPTGFWDG